MDRRPILHEIFCDILGTRNVYFQSPASVKMKYPAIRYSLSRIDAIHANNRRYKNHTCYEVVLMDIDPESEFVNKLLELPMCSFSTSYAVDGLNHWVFSIYY